MHEEETEMERETQTKDRVMWKKMGRGMVGRGRSKNKRCEDEGRRREERKETSREKTRQRKTAEELEKDERRSGNRIVFIEWINGRPAVAR